MAVVINASPPRDIPPELLVQLKGIPPAAIGHMLDFGFMSNELRPVGISSFAVCGPALTVRTSAMDSAVVHLAIDMAEPGDVIVVDRNGEEKHAAWGELTSLAAKLRGVAGAIVDGAATDTVEVAEMGFPVFCRSISPITSRSIGESGEINTVVQCGGVSVAPGDVILADDNGILVVPKDQVREAVEHCGPRVAWEEQVRLRLLAGERLSDITGAADRLNSQIDAGDG